MKDEVEFKYLIILLNSKFIRGFFNICSGCKNDFEKVCGVSDKDKNFRSWLNELIKDGSLEFYETKTYRGGKVDTFVINKKKMEKRLIKNPLYNPTFNYMEKNKFLFKVSK